MGQQPSKRKLIGAALPNELTELCVCYHDVMKADAREEVHSSRVKNRVLWQMIFRWYCMVQCFFGGRWGELDDDEDDVLVVTVRKRRILRGWSWNGVNYNNKITRKIVQFKSQSQAIHYLNPTASHHPSGPKRPADRIPCFFTRNQTRSSELLFSNIPDLKSVSQCSASLPLSSYPDFWLWFFSYHLFFSSWRAGFLFLLRRRGPIMFSSSE